MKWEELTGPAFGKAVEECGRVCILPLGIIEKHGDHLPLGTDAIHAYHVACRAAEAEAAMVFPFYYFGHNTHAKCEPGAIAIEFELIEELLEAVCDEICRNGFNRIIICNGHGGNNHMLGNFNYRMLDAERPYMIYILSTAAGRHNATCLEAKIDGHGGEVETSVMMAMAPELVKGPIAGYGLPREREMEFRRLKIETPTNWYSRHPEMLRGDQTVPSAEKGRELLKLETDALVELIRLVKTDDTPVKLYKEFHARCRSFQKL